MLNTPAPDPELGERIKEEELAFIMGGSRKAEATHGCPSRPIGEVKPWGIALSGGGIRSATFSLGVLQALADSGLLRSFHYLSTISGGGYAGAFLQGLIHRGGVDRAMDILASHVGQSSDSPGVPPDDDPPRAAGPENPGAPAQGAYFVRHLQRPVRHLREYSNYLSPRKDLLSGDTLGMLGTYLRNVVLIQIQLFALAYALSLSLLLLYQPLLVLGRDFRVACLFLAGACAVVAGILLRRISSPASSPQHAARPKVQVPSNPLGDPEEEQPTRQVLRQALVIIWLVAGASILCALGLWAPGHAGRPNAHFNYVLMGLTSACYMVVWLIWLEKFAPIGSNLPLQGEQASQRHLALRFLGATIAASLLAGVTVAGLRMLAVGWFASSFWHVIAFGPACVLAAVMVTGVVHVGLAGPALTDLQREMWARVAGKAAAAVLAWAGVLAMMVYVPWLMVDQLGRMLHITGWISVGVWLAATGVGVLAAYSQKSFDARARSLALNCLARAAPTVFLMGLLIAVSWSARSLMQRIVDTGCWAGRFAPSCSGLDGLALLARDGWPQLLMALATMLAIWVLFGSLVDLNEFSMNAFYRNRLVRCYLGASNPARDPEPTTNFDTSDDILLAEVTDGGRDADGRRPLFPLIGTTLNLVDAKQLDWQDRKAASFVFTPKYSGYVPPPSHPDATAVGDRRSGDRRSGDTRLAQTMMLGSALAISGAAVSPNMGYHSSPSVTLLLTLFDARLGWWLPNPGFDRSSPRKAPQITFYGKWLVREMLGRTREEDSYIYLSDGGHFENLGIYELVRRRCEFILCVDSTADPDGLFADLGNAIHKCRTDFGCDIDLDVSALRRGADGRARRHCALGTVRYGRSGTATEEVGTILYIKPSLAGDETADVAYYARVHPTFPHESTADQYFDEAQFESYRRLGRGIAATVLDKVIERAKAENQIDSGAVFGLARSGLKDSFLRELRYQWVAPLKGVERHFSKHARAMALLFAKLRKEPALSALDGHLYPAWDDMARTRPKADPSELVALPENDEFRACFYFCQELIRLMESVYHDLDFEKAWDHPDNRGWMNAFRQWSWSPVFRIAWAVGSPTYGKPFVTFCELRFGLPALDMERITTLRHVDLDPAWSWEHTCKALLDERDINSLEYAVLLAAPLAEAVADARQGERHIFLLRLDWSEVMMRAHSSLKQTTVGVAVLVDGKLRVLRIQDHVRQMGLASVFIRNITRRNVRFDGVEIRPGDYGELRPYPAELATRYSQKLDAIRRQAQSRGLS
ncbi:MAG TPA: hypothetical protein VFH59_18100 [Frateuria sp.]|uniref:hypothetical protein n=1 Tax=Frateuria sp. TaxID=2211372 RepID=UPI002D7F28B2|nr:hypothetical protein [Frateuria sp.]HET6807352.1 hypothetical protein [Frateuria sp.]